MNKERLWKLLVEAEPGEWDVRLILPKQRDGVWPESKRLFVVMASPVIGKVKLMPLLGEGQAFETDLTYLRERTVILQDPRTIGPHLARQLHEIMSASDFDALNEARSYGNWQIELRSKMVKSYNVACSSMNTKHLPDREIINRFDKPFTQEYEAYGAGGIRRSAKMEIKKMTVARQLKNDNVKAVKVAATITAGKTMNGLVADKVVPFLPENMKLLADTPIGAIVIANLVNTLATVYNDSNGGEVSAKLVAVGNAMVTAATVDFVQAFDIDEIVREFLSSSEAKAVLEKV